MFGYLFIFVTFAYLSKNSFYYSFSQKAADDVGYRKLALYLSLPACMGCSAFSLIKLFGFMFGFDIGIHIFFLIFLNNSIILILIDKSLES